MLRDELLSAYLDGELDAEQRARVESDLRSDKNAVLRLERMRNADSLLRQAIPVKTQPRDDRLAAMILAPQTHAKRPIQVMRWAPLAAAIVAGVLIGQLTHLTNAADAPFSVSDNQARLLETLPSGNEVSSAHGVFEVVLTLQTETGPCRAYRVSQGAQSTEVLACRDGAQDWRMVAAAATGHAEGYTPAGGASVIDRAVADLGPVEALNADQERALITNGWR